MTPSKNRTLKDKKHLVLPTSAAKVFSLIALISIFVLSLLYPDRITHSVMSGLDLCYKVIIPSVFPFLVLSDLIYSTCDFSSAKSAGAVFEMLFKINRRGLLSFALGLCCGFPLGVKCCVESYRSGDLSKSEAERLIGFCNNTGPAFIVCGIGLGLRKSLKDGVILYLAMVLSAVMVGIIFSIGEKNESFHGVCKTKKRFSITDSIRNAGSGTLNICSFITFFACIVGLFRALIGESLPYLFLITFVEIGSATSILSKTKLLSELASLAMTAFAISFSGFSVHLQALSYISVTDLKVKKYFAMKLLQGTLSAVFLSLFYIISH